MCLAIGDFGNTMSRVLVFKKDEIVVAIGAEFGCTESSQGFESSAVSSGDETLEISGVESIV
jgi:hypothetical protein